MRWDIINKLIAALGYKSYLEIGVDNRALNFNKIKCQHKTCVDPNPAAKADYVMGSDEFFELNDKTFDIIFIDGLHHYQQVIRDIFNSLDVLNKGGSIVVHDCNPTTEAMQKVPRIQGEWTGDVWRAWCYFREFTGINQRVYDVDYGVGVIRFGMQSTLTIPYDTATYEEFDRNRKQWLNLVPYEKSLLSICIPAFEQYGKGVKMLTDCLNSLKDQKGNFEVIVADNSPDGILYETAKSYSFVKYYRNDIRGISANTNFAISKATSKYIKILYQDDIAMPGMVNEFLTALQAHKWVCSQYTAIDEHGRNKRLVSPKYGPHVIRGRNTIGMPSVTGFHKPDFDFDTNLKTLLDCDYYYQLHKAYGDPFVINKPLIGARYWDYSTSRQQGNMTDQEWPYLKQKHGIKDN